MKIDLIANDGSPLGVTPPDIYGKGVGGAEYALLSLMEALATRGHEVTVYNDPDTEGEYDNVEYRPRRLFRPRHPRDVLIVFRSPNPLLIDATAELRKVWWSTDQYTIGSFKVLSTMVDYCVTISPFHTQYLLERYQMDPKLVGHIDLGVRLQDYVADAPKVKNRMIFCSVPDRGLSILHAAWPLIARDVPDASLTITSDYTLWGVNENNAQHRLNWAGLPGVEFLGNVPREELVKYQMEAELLPYPCSYEELFCVSVAECQVAGAFPVTSTLGALPTTNEFGIQVSGDLQNPRALQENFVDRIVGLLTHDRDYLEDRIAAMKVSAKLRFDWDTIAQKWEGVFTEGKVMR